jgi:aminoglycoside 6'-N-acetyltransferase/ribosomal-protein-alanine N-acetyltransferase
VSFRVEPATPALFSERAARRNSPPYDFYNDDGVPPKNTERFYSVCSEDGRVAGFR